MAVKFNPVKQEVDGKQAHRVIWSSDALGMALNGLEQGRRLIANPFYENNTKLMKGDLVFERSPEEISEWKKCKDDILYFAEKYCKLMTPKGVKNIKLRDYQEEYLRHLEKNRLSIFVSCRQSGKCFNMSTMVLTKLEKNLAVKLKKRSKFISYIKEEDAYEIPLFELYNLFDNRWVWKIKYNLYKLLWRLKTKSKKNERS